MAHSDMKDRQQCMTLSFCFAILLTMAFGPTCANNTVTAMAADNNDLKVSELPFSSKLSNPCSLTDPSHLQTANLTRRQKEDTMILVVNETKAKTLQLRDSAESILRTHVNQICSKFELPPVAIIPSDDEISDKRPLEVLRLFYTSLLNHTAYVYFISEQLQRYSEDYTCSSPELNTSSKSLARDMTELMCVIRIAILTLEQPDDDEHSFDSSTEQILNKLIVDQPVCSRRSIRDCQIVSSTVTLLRRLSNYLQRTELIENGNDSLSTESFYPGPYDYTFLLQLFASLLP